jgi:hypothetical protein
MVGDAEIGDQGDREMNVDEPGEGIFSLPFAQSLGYRKGIGCDILIRVFDGIPGIDAPQGIEILKNLFIIHLSVQFCHFSCGWIFMCVVSGKIFPIKFTQFLFFFSHREACFCGPIVRKEREKVGHGGQDQVLREAMDQMKRSIGEGQT